MLEKNEFFATNYTVSPEIYDQSLPQIATAKASLHNFIKSHQFKKHMKILDLGCGTGLLANHVGTLFPKCEVIGLDNAENMIKFAQEHNARHNVNFAIEDITKFNPQRKKSADFILCSWVISHIPLAQQQDCAKNFFNYLKKDGKLLVIFPLMGSTLAKIINEVANSKEYESTCNKATKSRVNYTEKEYEQLLAKTGFTNWQVQKQDANLTFNNKEELECFIITAVARYLSCFEDNNSRTKFIQAISERYCLEKGGAMIDIPYDVTLLTATAQRPNVAHLMQQSHSPIYSMLPTADLSPDPEAVNLNNRL
jgi:trans-aconitate methyltransferase